MASTIKIKNSSTAGAVPGTGDLVQGELAINVTDRRIFTENASGTVVELGTPSIDDNGNATAITIDSSENVGVGVVPSAWVSGDTVVQVKAGSGSGALWGRSNSLRLVGNTYYDGTNYKYIASDYASFLNINPGSVGGFSWNIAPSGTAGNNATFTQAMTLDSSGNLLVGTTSAVGGAARIGVLFAGNATNGLNIQDSTTTSGTVFQGFSNSSGTTIGSISRVGTTNAIVYNTTSDQRLKLNIKDAAPVLDSLMQVQVRQYDWAEGDLHQDYGFVAQELEPLLSGIVTKGKTEEDTWQVDYSRLTPHLAKAIQEQQALINAQQAALTTLTERITALEAK